jgi:homoserine kinase type II
VKTVLPSDYDLVCAWRIGTILNLQVPDTGTIHRTVLVDADQGSFALRGYRYKTRRRIENEHALIRHAAANGLPVPLPLPLPDGRFILEYEGRFYALFDRAAGEQRARDDLSPREVAAMGACLSRVHQALQDFPAEHVQARSLGVDSSAALATIARVETAILAQPARDVWTLERLRRLQGQRDWIERMHGHDPPSLAGQSTQVIHGDYQQTNLFFRDGEVSGIIDWDQAYVAPRAWEVVRTLHLVWDLAPQSCGTFLAAYRGGATLDDADLDLAAAAYGWMRGHDTWSYEAYFLDGNTRVRTFMSPPPFVPFAEQWALMRRRMAR